MRNQISLPARTILPGTASTTSRYPTPSRVDWTNRPTKPICAGWGTMNPDAIKDFMSRVVPWPQRDEGYIGLFTHGGKRGDPFKGIAVTSLDAFMREFEEVRNRSENIYFWTAQGDEARPDGGNKLTPTRQRIRVKLLQSIFFDIDAGEGKPYADTKAVLAALKAFLAASGVPAPSAIVASGSGGAHVYWFSDRPLIPQVWQQYADGLRALAEKHGLQIDGGCPADSARVLRVPGTKNWKHSPPREVKLLGMGKVYEFAAELQVLLNTAPASRRVAPSPRRPLPAIPERFKNDKAVIVVDPADLPPGFGPMPAEEIRACLD